MAKEKFLIARTADALDLPLPTMATTGSAGYDLHANIIEDKIIPKGSFALIPSGIKISLPNGYEAQIRPRSGLAIKNGISLLNTPGTIDSDYRGEIKLIMINFSNTDFVVHRGDRIGQMVINKIEISPFLEVSEDELDSTERGEGGFGHTGLEG